MDERLFVLHEDVEADGGMQECPAGSFGICKVAGVAGPCSGGVRRDDVAGADGRIRWGNRHGAAGGDRMNYSVQLNQGLVMRYVFLRLRWHDEGKVQPF